MKLLRSIVRIIRRAWCWDVVSTHVLRRRYRIVRHSWLRIYRVQVFVGQRWHVVGNGRRELFIELRNLNPTTNGQPE